MTQKKKLNTGDSDKGQSKNKKVKVGKLELPEIEDVVEESKAASKSIKKETTSSGCGCGSW